MSDPPGSDKGLWSPQDVVVKIIIWLGAPALVVIVFNSIFALLGWKSFLRSTTRIGVSAGRSAWVNLHYWTTERQRAFAKLILASSGFVAVAYSFAQLMGWFVTSVRDTPAVWKQDHVDWHFVLQQVLDYQRWGPESRWTVLGSAVAIALLNLADLSNLGGLRSVIVGVGYVVLGAALIGACFVGLTAAPLAIGVLFMPDAPIWLLALELIAIACLTALPYLGRAINGASMRAYTASSASVG